MGLLGSYFWIILTAAIVDAMIKVTFFLTGFFLVLSTFALAGAKRRGPRVIFTAISGLTGGIHGYLDIVSFREGFWGALMFSWLAFGLLLSFAALAWLPETD